MLVNRRCILYFFVLIIFITASANATIYSDTSYITTSLKYENGLPTLQDSLYRVALGKQPSGEMEYKEPSSPELKPEPTADEISEDSINKIILVGDGTTYKHNIQTPTISKIYLTTRTIHDFDIIQISDDPSFHAIEIYWNYDAAPEQPWRYYLNMQHGSTVATFADFQTKRVWRQTITDRQISDMKAGYIPSWGDIT